MNIRRYVIGFAALLAVGGVALAQSGFWPNWPIVGGAAYCSSYTNAVCTNTVPAGPTAVTGNENIPGNTNLTGGRNPQNVLLSMRSLGVGPTDYEAITAGAVSYSYTFDNLTRRVTFTSSVTISDERVTAPPSPMDGQLVDVCSVRTITAFQFIANTGQSLAATTPTVLTASTTVPQCYSWQYRSSNTTWYRVM